MLHKTGTKKFKYAAKDKIKGNSQVLPKMEKQTTPSYRNTRPGSYWYRIKSKNVYSSSTWKIILGNNSEIQQEIKSKKKKW